MGGEIEGKMEGGCEIELNLKKTVKLWNFKPVSLF